MGDSLREGSPVELPVHKVTVGAFAIQKKEVTKAQWDEVAAWGHQHGYTDLAKCGGKAPDHPVQRVTWYGAVKWCNARSDKEGLTPCYCTDAAKTTVYRTGEKDIEQTWVRWDANGYRLPTEAEWERAARGGLTGKRFPWGDTISHSQANYKSNAFYAYDVSPTRGEHPTYDDGNKPDTSPVGSFAANAYGLHDMAGNVAEWCCDWLGNYPSGPQPDPHGPAAGTERVTRGGTWSYYAWTARCAARGSFAPDDSSHDIGFRLVRRQP